MNPEILIDKLFLKISESIQLLPLDEHFCRDKIPARIIFVIDLHHCVHVVDIFWIIIKCWIHLSLAFQIWCLLIILINYHFVVLTQETIFFQILEALDVFVAEVWDGKAHGSSWLWRGRLASALLFLGWENNLR